MFWIGFAIGYIVSFIICFIIEMICIKIDKSNINKWFDE